MDLWAVCVVLTYEEEGYISHLGFLTLSTCTAISMPLVVVTYTLGPVLRAAMLCHVDLNLDRASP
jgi:hypothetical protein